MLPKTNLQPSVNIVLTVNGINSTNFTFIWSRNKQKQKKDKSHMICIKKIIHILFLWLCRSLVEQMKEAAQAYMDLLEGKDKPVFGSTCKFHCSVFRNVGHFYYFDGIRLVFTTCSGYRCDQFLNRITQSAFIYCFIDIQSSENVLKCVEVLAPTLRNVWLRPTSKFRSAEQKRLKSFMILFERHGHVLRRDGGMQDKGFVLKKK